MYLFIKTCKIFVKIPGVSRLHVSYLPVIKLKRGYWDPAGFRRIFRKLKNA